MQQHELMLELLRLSKLNQHIQIKIEVLLQFHPIDYEQLDNLNKLQQTIAQQIKDTRQYLIDLKNVEIAEKSLKIKEDELNEIKRNNKHNNQLATSKLNNETHNTKLSERKLKFEIGPKFWISGVLILGFGTLVGLFATLYKLGLL